MWLERIAVAGDNDYEALKRAVQDDIACWTFDELAVGEATLYFPVATELVVVKGQAVVGEHEVRAGAWLRIPAKTTLRWRVGVLLGYRCHAPEMRALEGSVAALCQRMSEPTETRGRFVRLAESEWAAPLGDKAAIFFSAVPRPPDESWEWHPGPLFAALFALGKEQIAIAPIWITEATTRVLRPFDCNPMWAPTGSLVRPSAAIATPLLERLRACGEPLFQAVTAVDPSYSSSVLEQLASVWGADRELSLDRSEELFVFFDGALHRWRPSPSGEPIERALGPVLAQRAPSAPLPQDLEPIIEQLLASLWGADTPEWVTQYMTLRPKTVPYRVGSLCAPLASSLSPAFRSRWQIYLTCDSAVSSLPIENGVNIRYDGYADTSLSTTLWVVRWASFYEMAEWSYRVTRTNGELKLERTLLDQHD